ncbi:MAG: bifunctional DNA primase/polymerase [Pseudonocardia sp.]
MRALTTALSYAEHGWPVLPGSAWNGRRYQVPGSPTRHTDGIRPTEPRNYATTDPDMISGWWSPRGDRLFPTVLLRSGLAFDVFSVEREIAATAIRDVRFRSSAGPVIFRPDQGRAYFMVTPARFCRTDSADIRVRSPLWKPDHGFSFRLCIYSSA